MRSHHGESVSTLHSLRTIDRSTVGPGVGTAGMASSSNISAGDSVSRRGVNLAQDLSANELFVNQRRLSVERGDSPDLGEADDFGFKSNFSRQVIQNNSLILFSRLFT